ncbi:MAG: pyrroline-5-carboxylate reductase [Gammaproteobacteria bacterium]
MHTKRITFIGGGNMAGALLARLAEERQYDLRVSDPGEEPREKLGKLGVTTFTDNEAAVDGADCVIFAVKPQIMRSVCTALASAVAKHEPLLVSVAAGIGCEPMSRWFDGYRRIVRVMPNTPALLGAGATGLFGDSAVTPNDMDLVSNVFESVGETAWVETEELIDVVTAVSGSGPAYFFYFLEAMEDAAVAQGLSRALAQKLARQTALGAALMAQNEEGPLMDVRRRVTSPGGTTAAAVDTLAEHKLRSIIEDAMKAARTRALTLADEFGTD